MFEFFKKINLFNRKASATSQSGKFTLENFIQMIKGGAHSRVSASTAYAIYNTNSAVSDAVDMIANKFAIITPVVKNDKGEITSDHKALKILRKPNKMERYRAFANSMAVNFLLERNSYLELLGFFKSAPNEIYNVKNSTVSIAEGANSAKYLVNTSGFFQFLQGNFNYDQESGRLLESSNLRELYHTRGFFLSSGNLKAVSKITSILRESNLVDQSNLHNLSLLKNGFSSGALLSVDTEDKEAYEEFDKAVTERYTGAGNAGKPITAMGKSVTATQFDQSNKDMQHKETRKEAKNTVYERYEIPAPLVDQSSQTYNNYQTAIFALYDNAVLPLADIIYEALTEILQDRKVLGENEVITYDIRSIPALQIRTNEEIKVLKDAGVLTINELRAKAGYEGVTEGGDDIYIQAGMMPIASDLFRMDNLTEPSKGFLETLEQAGYTKEEAKDYWNEYKSAFRPNPKG